MMLLSESLKHVMTLGNSIIGVSVLAMPYCFKQCGIILGIVILMVSALLTRFNCHLLLKAAMICRRKTYENLAFHSFGFYGKLAVETSIIGFLLGILISFYVVIGDIAPAIISNTFNVENNQYLRTIILTAIGLGIALPLGLLKTISSLGSISTLSFAFYAFLVFKIFVDAFPVLVSEKWWQKISYWQPEGTLRCLPIFSLALSCQTQIFEIYDSLPDPSLGKMNKIIKVAIYLCTSVYVLVGFLGYIAFCNEEFSGNVLVNMPSSFLTKIIKLGFVLSVALSFPLVIFPCRTSLCSLLSKKSYTGIDVTGNYIPEVRFRTITISIVLTTLIMGILCPNIELVLGLVGSTIGTIICIVFPAMMFIHVTNRNILERYGAQVVLCAGLFLLVACTYVTIHKAPEREDHNANVINSNLHDVLENPQGTLVPDKDSIKVLDKPVKLQEIYEPPKIEKPVTMKAVKDKEPPKENVVNEQRRLEPPIPQEPEVQAEKKKEVKSSKVKPVQEEAVKKIEDPVIAIEKTTPKEEVKPEEKIRDVASQQEELLKKIEKQQKEQMKLIEEQKHLLEELKAHKESHHKDAAAEGNDGSDGVHVKDEIKKEENKVDSLAGKLPAVNDKDQPLNKKGLSNADIEERGAAVVADEIDSPAKETNKTVSHDAVVNSKFDSHAEKALEVTQPPSDIKEHAKDKDKIVPSPIAVAQKKLENVVGDLSVDVEKRKEIPKQEGAPIQPADAPKEIVIEKREAVHEGKPKKENLPKESEDAPVLLSVKEKLPEPAKPESYKEKVPAVEVQTQKVLVLRDALKEHPIPLDVAPKIELPVQAIKVINNKEAANVWRKDEQK